MEFDKNFPDADKKYKMYLESEKLATSLLCCTDPGDCLQEHLDLPDLDELQDPHGGEEVLPGLLAVGVLQQSLRILVHLLMDGI